MTLALLLLLLAQAPTAAAPQVLVDIRVLSPREHRVSAFVLGSPQDVSISAVGAEPWPDRLRMHDNAHFQDDEQTTWPAAAWILDARTRAVVWDLRAVDTKRESNGLRRFAGSVRLPAGTYEAHYASYPGTFPSFPNSIGSFQDLVRLGRRARNGGPYVEKGLYKEFALSIQSAAGAAARVASDSALKAARRVFTSSAIATVVPERRATARQGFALTRPTSVEVYAIGELTPEGESDYGWIMDVATRKRVWAMSYVDTDPAGGAAKNRVAHETLRLKPGRYVAYFVSDDSHDPEEWNGVPATDPEFWGLMLRVADPAARAAVKPFEYQPVPEGQTIVSLIELGNDEQRSAGFALKRAMDVHIYAIGEGNRDMVDYGWIIDADTHQRVWTMAPDNTVPAGGSEKNRLFDGKVHLTPGNYLVYYRTDGSHAYDDWNAAPPAEARYWGVSLYPESGRLNPADIGPFARTGRGSGTALAQLLDMGDNDDARTTFRLTAETRLRIYAVGEGRDHNMFDYGWIEDEHGRRVWEMDFEHTEPAGGADKNRMFEGVITLPAGTYVLRYSSDGSHSHADWNDDPPDDPESWGISVFRLENR
jgi:hypothetical protein